MVSGGYLALLVLLAIYVAPTIVAIQRRHRNTLGVFALNLLLGWTLLGWAGALVWAIASENEQTAVSVER